ncbi:MAG: hypothetical protein KDD22_04035 [Bdellovibrionales bacterium]|nr:hypothetical protein [Bdellovibrionales bacterium]
MTARSVMMVRPQHFRCNEQTLSSNAFQKAQDPTPTNLTASALAEFDGMKRQLLSHGISVYEFQEPEGADTPDCLFPNNWIAHIPKDRGIIFPMEAPNRQREVHLEWIHTLLPNTELLDLREFAETGEFLEGTGSLILDHKTKSGFACLSSRTHPRLLEVFEQVTGYTICSFTAKDEAGIPYYHTNVIMTLGQTDAVICLEAINSPEEQDRVLRKLVEIQKRPLILTRQQVRAFCGNMIQLENPEGNTFWLASESAYKGLTQDQRGQLEEHSKFITAPLFHIEKAGGGSARCMVAEIF